MLRCSVERWFQKVAKQAQKTALALFFSVRALAKKLRGPGPDVVGVSNFLAFITQIPLDFDGQDLYKYNTVPRVVKICGVVKI